MPNEHAPLVVRDFTLVPWGQNTLSLLGPDPQYGYGCLDGMVNVLKIVGDSLFLAAVDAGAHFARHIRNSASSVLLQSAGEVGTLEQAVKTGRSYDDKYPVRLEVGSGFLDFDTYYQLYLVLMFENMDHGFVHGNYVRPFYAPSGERHDRQPNDAAIDEEVYRKTFSLMMFYWPNILLPRSPVFPGLNVLVSQNAASPYPGTTLIEYKAASSYQPTRGPAVKEKNIFNRLGLTLADGSALVAHDVLILDHLKRSMREASGSNLFFVAPNGTFYTPPLDGSIFPGLTRDFVTKLIKGEVGQASGFDFAEQGAIGVEMARKFSQSGFELFLTGSALGLISVKRLIVPKVRDPESIDDYEILEFKTGAETHTATVADCYRCFSIGDGFEVDTPRGKVQSTEFVSCPLLIEIPEHLREKAKEKFLKPNGTRLEVPTDQTMRSRKVRPIAARDNRVITREEYRRIGRIALHA